MENTVYIALGSNLGDRRGNLQRALGSLGPEIELVKLSPIYETEPWGYAAQPNFLNQVVEARTELGPREVLDYLKVIEQEVGRRPTFRYGPRQIDLDLLMFSDLVLHEDGLTLPHPGVADRGFVLKPLADLAPDLVHPELGVTIGELLAQADTNGVRPYGPSEG